MNSDAHSGDGWEPLTTVPREYYDILQHPQRLRILEILGTHEGRLTISELTSELVDTGASQARYERRLGLVHNHLPRLNEAAAVNWDATTGVELADSFPIEPTALSRLLAYCDSQELSDPLETIVHPVRLPICSLLAASDRPMSLDRLATELAERGVSSDSDQAAIVLHHSHLPALDAIGLLEYNVNSGLVYRAEYPLPALV